MTRLLNLLSINHPGSRIAIGLIGALLLVTGLAMHHPGLIGGGAVLGCLAIRSMGEVIQRRKTAEAHLQEERAARGRRVSESSSLQQPSFHEGPSEAEQVTHACGTDALVDEMLSMGRYALLLRPETKNHLEQEQIVRAIRQLDAAMALVPAGNVLLGQFAERANDLEACGRAPTTKKQAEGPLRVEATYLDRHTISNEEFQKFVDAGGYEKLEFWHEEALPALLDFVDQTGQPGPRFWFDGLCENGEERLPVVGVSWYEAWAYARWVGKQLPSDAEWTKAGAWPVESEPGRIAQRRYPWGESFDVRRSNLWGSNRKEPVDVDDFSGGASVGGICQLIGNVWEWTTSSLCESLHVPDTFKSIRGGAFDTYFENQATCHFLSGEHPLSRRANIGFRLALPMATLEADKADEGPSEEPCESMDGNTTEDAAVAC